MVLILGGLPGGDPDAPALWCSKGEGRAGATSDIRKAAASSRFCNFEIAIACGEIACLQQECDIGIAELSHMLAILMQQARSAAVIVWPGVRQAASGWPRRTSIRMAATICDTRFSIAFVRGDKRASRQVVYYSF